MTTIVPILGMNAIVILYPSFPLINGRQCWDTMPLPESTIQIQSTWLYGEGTRLMHLSFEEIRILCKVCDNYAQDLADPWERAQEPALELADLSPTELQALQRIRLRLATYRARKAASQPQEVIHIPALEED